VGRKGKEWVVPDRASAALNRRRGHMESKQVIHTAAVQVRAQSATEEVGDVVQDYMIQDYMVLDYMVQDYMEPWLSAPSLR
jgi:hypothetical protein